MIDREEIVFVPYIVCPLCGLHRKLHKNGIYALRRKKAGQIESRAAIYNPDKDTRFDIVNLEKEPFISLRLSSGRGSGLKEVKTYTLEEAITSKYREEVIELLEQMRGQALRVIDTIDRILKK